MPSPMKIRTDFVTNSSSSSFIIAHRKELTDKQKEAILDFVTERFLTQGEEITADNLEEMREDYGISAEETEEIKQALADGKQVNFGWVDFECAEDLYGRLFQDLWDAIEESDPDNFDGIDTRLEY